VVLSIAVFAVTYLLIASEKVDKAVAAGLGASAVIMLHAVGYEEALRHVDLNVIFLLIGMMMIVNVLGRTGLFEYIAIRVARATRGSGLATLVLLVVATAVLSAFLDNVTTVILVAPVTILLCQVLELPVVPFLVTEAVFSNIGGTATLIGDPPNVLIGSQAGISFNAFLVHLAPAVVVVMMVCVVIIARRFRRDLQVRQYARQRIFKAEPHLAIVQPGRLKRGLVVFAFVLAGFFLGPLVDIEPGIVALAGGMLMVAICRVEPHRILGKVEWNTIMFFIGLFMLVGALEYNGAFTWLGERIVSVTKGNLLMTTLLILWASAIVSAVVDNIPLVIAMIPMIRSIIPTYAAQLHLVKLAMIQVHVAYPLYWALALGACLGGNGSLVGASANVVISQIAHRNGYDLSFWRFTRSSFPMMIVSLILSTFYIWLRYFVW